MQPNEQTEQPLQQHPIDYLDSISTVPRGVKKGPSNVVFFGAIIGALLVSLLVGAFVFLASDDDKADLSTLSVRLENLQTVADDSQKKTVSGRMRATNTSLSLALANANRDITTLLTENGIEPEKIDPKIIASEGTEDLDERLEDARLNGIFDRIYAREMAYELQTTLILIEQLESETKSEKQKAFLITTHENITPLQENFSKFDATTN